MKRVVRLFGVVSLVIAFILGLLTLVTWPPGGLMFALPYFFLFPAVFFTIIGIVLLIVTPGRGVGPV